MKKYRYILLALILVACATLVMGSLPSFDSGATIQRDNCIFGTATITTITGTTIAATNATVATAITRNGIVVTPFDAVSVTAPTKTFTATGKSRINLTTSESQTGFTITGGTLGQEIVVYGTSDSETSQFDDGTSYTLGGNITLGVGDALGLICVSTDGDEWRRNFSADN